MNICDSEVSMPISARTCSCKEKNGKRVAYTLIESYHGLCLDKKDIIISELEACITLLKYSIDEADRSTIERNSTIKDYARSFIVESFLLNKNRSMDYILLLIIPMIIIMSCFCFF